MQAYVLHGIEDLKLENRPTPQIGPRDVLVDIKRVGICGSDIHYYLHSLLSNCLRHDTF